MPARLKFMEFAYILFVVCSLLSSSQDGFIYLACSIWLLWSDPVDDMLHLDFALMNSFLSFGSLVFLSTRNRWFETFKKKRTFHGAHCINLWMILEGSQIWYLFFNNWWVCLREFYFLFEVYFGQPEDWCI